MDDYVVELKKRVRIEDVVSETVDLERHSGYGYTRGAKRGAGEHGLVVNMDKQLYFWNSNPNYGNGDVINWVMVRDRVDFKRALEILTQKCRMEPPKWSEEQRAAMKAVRVQEDALSVAQRVFEKWLWRDKKALAYARGRGWTDETIRSITFLENGKNVRGAGLGFTGWGTDAEYEEMKQAFATATDLFLPAAVSVLGMKGGVQAWCERHGIKPKDKWVAKDYIPSMLGWGKIVGLIYPHFYMGRVTYLSRRHLEEKDGRLVGSDNPKSYNLPKELIGERKMYFGHGYAPAADSMVLVEGQADAVTWSQWGYSPVAIAGTSWKDHADEITRLRVDLEKRKSTLYLGLDMDKAGKAAIQGKDADWAIADAVGAESRILTLATNDANALRQACLRHELDDDTQLKLIGRVISRSNKLAVIAAQYARDLPGGDDDPKKMAAMLRAIELIAQMDSKVVNASMGILKEATGKPISDIKRMLVDARGEIEAANEDGPKKDAIYSYGGRVGDWLLEYCCDLKEGKARWAYRSPEGNVDMADEIVIDGLTHIPEPPTDKMLIEGVISFPSELGEKKTIKEIVDKIIVILHSKYIFRDPKIPQLAAYYIMLTWMYDNFTKLCYLRAVGEPGSGKSQMMELIGFMCYRFTRANGADSLATFFRVTDKYRGTVFFEEADLPDKSDESNPIVKFINMGAMDGNHILRMDEYIRPDGTKGFRPTPFASFCPKLFAMRGDFDDDAVGSRSITFKLQAATMQDMIDNDIEVELGEDYKNFTSLEIRNLALTWRLHNYQLEKRRLTNDLADPMVSARMNQVTMPLKALAGEDEDFKKQIQSLLRSIQAENVLEKSQTIEAMIVEAIWKMYLKTDLNERMVIQSDGSILIKIGDVASITNNIMDEINSDGADLRLAPAENDDDEGGFKKRKKKSYDVSSKRVGTFVRESLQLNVPPRRGSGFFFEFDYKKMVAAGKKYGVLPEENEIDAANKRFELKNSKKIDTSSEQIGFEVNEEVENEENTLGW